MYARRQLGPVWGYLAGWGFVVGKTASCVAHRAHRRRLPVARSRPARRCRSGRGRGDRQHRRVDPHRRRHQVPARGGAGRARLGRHRRLVEPDHLARTHHPDRHLAGRRPARRPASCSSRSPATPASPPSARRSATRRPPSPRRSRAPWPACWWSTPRSASPCSPPFPSTPSPRATHRSASSSAPRDSTGSLPSSASAPASPPSASSSTSSPASPAPCSPWPVAASSRSWFADDRRPPLAAAARRGGRHGGGHRAHRDTRPSRSHRLLRCHHPHLLRDHQRRLPDPVREINADGPAGSPSPGLAGCVTLAVMLPLAAVIAGTGVLVAGIAIRRLAPAARESADSRRFSPLRQLLVGDPSKLVGHPGVRCRGRAGVEGDRAGGTRVRRAGAAAVRRRSPQDDRDAPRRRLAAHLGHRVRVHRRRAPLRFDDRRAQGGGPRAGSPLRPARPDLPPRGGQGERLAGRGEDRRTSHPRRPGGHRRGRDEQPDGEMFVADITEVVITGLNAEATKLVVESWTPERGLRRVERD